MRREIAALKAETGTSDKEADTLAKLKELESRTCDA